MLYYIVNQQHAYTINEYLESWGKALASRFRVLHYGTMMRIGEIEGGVFIFSDIDRLTPAQLPPVTYFWDTLASSGKAVLLNNPHDVLRRLELLQTLHDRGINPFNARAVTDGSRVLKGKVFCRRLDDHQGPRTQPTDNPDVLRKLVREVLMQGHPPHSLMEVEHLDTADAAGIYRKYASFRIGETILPRHLFFSRKWIVKDTDLVEPAMMEEQFEYIRTNPHEEFLREIFDLAKVSYGRIDYSMHNGRPVIWELNTNPYILYREDKYKPPVLPAYRHFSANLAAAFSSLDHTASSKEMIGIEWPDNLLERMLASRD